MLASVVHKLSVIIDRHSAVCEKFGENCTIRPPRLHRSPAATFNRAGLL